jgi:membrane-associated protease RseP (regulator of RpoE activity)
MPLAVGLLSILLAHEMGHYLACRYYRVDATLPFFIPAPPVLVGTFGALIRIRGPIPHRRALFDIGIAGPLAGFVVCLPVLVAGILEAQVLPTPAGNDLTTLSFGEPLLFRWATLWLKGPLPEGTTLFIGSWGLAAWFGLFVTALNLIPVGQLDGGHVTYALFRQRAHVISRLGFVGCLGLIYFGPNWVIWSLLLLVVGRHQHPPTMNDYAPVGRTREIVGAIGLLVFVVCFVPDPIIGSWEMFGAF